MVQLLKAKSVKSMANMFGKNVGGFLMEKNKKKFLKALKEAIKKGSYDWETAIEHAASKIADYPQALLWR